MLRAMYTGVSGLRTHQSKMDVIGNNIANVNTVGFKRSTATFKETFSQTLQGASGAQGGLAGTNPQQVGLGVTQGATTVVHTQGAAQATGNPMDVMVNGETFFVVSNDENAINRYYTRAGNFQVDELGTLSNPDGYKVLGYTVDENGNIGNEPGPLTVNRSSTMEPTTTQNISITGNLNSQAKIGDTTVYDNRVYDSLGNSYTLKYEAVKTGDNTWTNTLIGITDANGNQLYKTEIDDTVPPGDAAYPTYKAPSITDITVTGGTGTPANIYSQAITFDNKGSIDTTNTTFLGPLNLVKSGVEFGATGDIKVDFKEIKQYGTDFSISAKRMDGNTAGNVSSFAINSSGYLMARYTNGEEKAMGVLALAKFENNAGLEKQGGNLYQSTRNSGDAGYGKAGQQGYGTVSSGVLEMSNVDLSYEFTEMITTQRGFQANSRIISTSDEILQELVNLKR